MLESLSLESKELTLTGTLLISHLTLRKCKTLKVDMSFKLPNVKSIKLEACSFNLVAFKKFLQEESLEKLEKIEIYNFIAYKIPKGFENELNRILPTVMVTFL
jgi:hypothetical protein